MTGAIAVVLVAAVLILSLVQFSYLILVNDESNTLLLKVRISDEEEFSVSYIHSANRSPVTEFYQVRNGSIVLTALEFATFGAGMPTELEPGQVLVNLPDGKMRIEGFDREIEALLYIIGYTTEHTLHVGQQNVPLTTLDVPGQLIQFNIVRLNFWQRLTFQLH